MHSIYIFFFISNTVGVPVKLLHEGEGHVVTVELKNGEVYKGLLTEAEDTMNCQMKEGELCFATYRKKLSLTKLFLWFLFIDSHHDSKGWKNT